MAHDHDDSHALTARERELVVHLARGLSGVEIAAELDLSADTVRTHLRNAMRRSGTRTRAHLVAAAVARGEVELDDAAAPAAPQAPPPPPVPQTPLRGQPRPADESPLQLIDHVLESARDMLRMDAAFVSDTRTGVQEFVALNGDSESFGYSTGMAIPLEETYCGLMLDDRMGNVVRDTASDPLVANLARTAEADIGAYIGVPVVLSDGSVFGTFCCLGHEPDPLLQERDAQFMHVLARLIADLLEHDAREAEARRLATRAEKVDVLLAALAARDGYAEARSHAVVELATAIAQKLGLGAEQLANVESVALLHGIGKIGIPDSILRKPGKLTEQEWQVMRGHAAIGERILLSVPTLAHLARAVRAEHERWDGSGYPDGLAGEAIPMASRIVLVADAYHAMTSDRPYRAALSKETALEELRANAGTQFWPAAVEAAEAVIDTRS